MAKSLTNFQNGVERPFIEGTSEVFSALAHNSGGLRELEQYFSNAKDIGLAREQTFAMADVLGSLEDKLNNQERLTQDDYMAIVNGMIDMIEGAFVNEDSKLENIRQYILLRILKDQDLHHKITTAGSIIEVLLVLTTTVINFTYAGPVAGAFSSMFLSGAYLQYNMSKPLHDYRKGVPKNYQLEINRRVAEEEGKVKNAVLGTIFLWGFRLSALVTPYTYMWYNNIPINIPFVTNEVKLSTQNTISHNEISKDNLGFKLVGLGLILEMIVAYMFLGFAKNTQKKLKRRDEVLIPYLNEENTKNERFFLNVLEALITFKNSVNEVGLFEKANEKDFLRIVGVLLESIKKLENDANADIKTLFGQASKIIEGIRSREVKYIPDAKEMVSTYPLLDKFRQEEKVELEMEKPKKRKAIIGTGEMEDNSISKTQVNNELN